MRERLFRVLRLGYDAAEVCWSGEDHGFDYGSGKDLHVTFDASDREVIEEFIVRIIGGLTDSGWVGTRVPVWVEEKKHIATAAGEVH